MNKTYKRIVTNFSLKTAPIAAAILLLGLPGFSSAMSFAYVNKLGEVKIVEANSSTNAMILAPNIHVNSGVMMLDSAEDYEMLGDRVVVV